MVIRPLILRTVSVITIIFCLIRCTQLHHAHIGDIDQRTTGLREPIEVRLSEHSIHIVRAAKPPIDRLTTTPLRGTDLLQVAALLQTGPRTGWPVLSPVYARDLHQSLRDTCSRGQLTDLVMVRESRDYAGLSGEVVKVTGHCMTPW